MEIDIKIGKVNNMEPLSYIQEQVLVMCCHGHNLSEMAEALSMSRTRVTTIRSSLFDIFAVSNNTMLCHAAVLNGIVKLNLS